MFRNLFATVSMIAVTVAIAGCGDTSATTPTPTSAAKVAKHVTPSRATVCDRFSRYLSQYDYIEKGTSVRAYDILFHLFQRNCPDQARREGEAWPERRQCIEPSESRFDCTAYKDDNILSLNAEGIEGEME